MLLPIIDMPEPELLKAVLPVKLLMRVKVSLTFTEKPMFELVAVLLAIVLPPLEVKSKPWLPELMAVLLARMILELVLKEKPWIDELMATLLVRLPAVPAEEATKKPMFELVAVLLFNMLGPVADAIS